MTSEQPALFYDQSEVVLDLTSDLHHGTMNISDNTSGHVVMADISLQSLGFVEEYNAIENIADDCQGVIKIPEVHQKVPKLSSRGKKLGQKQVRKRLCEQLGIPSKCHVQSNLLNLTQDEIQQIRNQREIMEMRKEAQFRKMFSSYVTGVIGDEGIMKEMNDLVAKHDHYVQRRKLSLYQRWHRKVFESIQEQIKEKLEMLTSCQIEDKLRYFHYKYVAASNRKPLFLHILDESFYDPFESLKYSIEYKTRFCDPLWYNSNKEKHEQLLIKGRKVSRQPVTRKTLDCSKWEYRAFRSSIWGHLNADEEDGSHIIFKNTKTWVSDAVLYNVKFIGKQYWEDVFPRGKHIVPNQGKGWSFQERQEGKGKVYGLECMTQPRLQLYYV